jgi:hypothetical protein
MDKQKLIPVRQPEYDRILSDLSAPKLHWANETHAWVDPHELRAWRLQNTSGAVKDG